VPQLAATPTSFPHLELSPITISKMVEERFPRSATSSLRLLAGVLTASLKNRKWGEREDFLDVPTLLASGRFSHYLATQLPLDLRPLRLSWESKV
jgi:hypothetical protein